MKTLEMKRDRFPFLGRHNSEASTVLCFLCRIGFSLDSVTGFALSVPDQLPVGHNVVEQNQIEISRG
jgi:hypothetical protein